MSDSIFNGKYTDQDAKGISTKEYEEIKKAAIEAQPVSKVIKLKDIEFDADAIAQDIIKIGGQPISCEPGFFQGLSKILNLNVGMRKKLIKDGSDTGREFYIRLVDAVKTFNEKNDGGSYTIMASPKTHSITNIIKGDTKRVSNEGLFGIVDRLMNDYPGLRLFDGVENNGNVGIKLLSSDMHDFGKTNGPDGGIEMFNFGMNLENNGLNTMLGDFAYRLVCENGMMGMKTINDFKLAGIDAGSIGDLFTHIQEVEQRGFLPYAFAEHIELANKANASYREVETMFRTLKKLLKIDDAELKDHYAAALGEQYFRGVAQAEAKIIQAGLDPRELTDKQKSFVDSGMNMWELINNMTFIGSHNTGFKFENNDLVQKIAGKQFHEEYDLAYAGLMKI